MMMHAIISYLTWKYMEFFWTEFWISGWFNKLNELTKNVEGRFSGIIEGGDQQNHESIQNEWKCWRSRYELKHEINKDFEKSECLSVFDILYME